MAAIRYVTGVNAEYFFILFPLFASLRRHAPDVRLEVCDFGLTEPQRAFLLDAGCDQFQGFLYAPALDALSFDERVQGRPRGGKPQLSLVGGR